MPVVAVVVVTIEVHPQRVALEAQVVVAQERAGIHQQHGAVLAKQEGLIRAAGVEQVDLSHRVLGALAVMAALVS